MNRCDFSFGHHHSRASTLKGLRLMLAASLAVVTVGSVACDRLPGKPPPNPAPVISVATTAGFEIMWAERCSGCHGADGQLGAGLPMRNAEYLKAVPDSDMFSMIRNGVPSSRMPGFGGDAIGGVSDEVIRDFIKGMQVTWAQGDASNDSLGLPWRAPDAPGDVSRGATVFAAKCAACHPAEQAAPTQRGSTPDQLIAGSVTDPFYLRRSVTSICGRTSSSAAKIWACRGQLAPSAAPMVVRSPGAWTRPTLPILSHTSPRSETPGRRDRKWRMVNHE